MGVNDGRVMASGGSIWALLGLVVVNYGYWLCDGQWGQNRGCVRASGDKLGLCDGQWRLNRGCVRASGG